MESRHNLWFKRQVRYLDNELIKHLFLYGLYTAIGLIALGSFGGTAIAAPMFPSAGLAMALVLLWGYRFAFTVFLANVTVTLLGHPEQFVEAMYGAAITIGIGAAVQAALAKSLIEKFIGWPSALDNARYILGFLLIAAPLSCAIGATVDVSALILFGIVPAESLWIEWQTWWLGDSLGVILFSPVILATLAVPRKDWATRVWLINISAAIAFGALVLMWGGTQSHERELTQLQFSRTASQRVELIHARLSETENALESLQQLFVLHPSLTREQFRQFSTHFLQEISGLQAMGFIKPIAQIDRDSYEKEITNSGFPSFEITDRLDGNQLIRAKEANEYYAITYIEPLVPNLRALGLNVLSVPVARFALGRATTISQAIMTAPFILTQETGVQKGTVMYQAVRNTSGALIGFVYVAVRVGDLVTSALENAPLKGISLCIYDDLVPMAEGALAIGNDLCLKPHRVSFEEVKIIGERRWRILLFANKDYLGEIRPGRIDYQIFGVITATLLFMSFVLLSSGQRRRVEALVDERTSDLEAASEQLHLLAYYDQLTGLPNRSRLMELSPALLSDAQQKQKRVALLYIDIDHFKRINDSLGHAAGDRLLVQVAERFNQALRGSDSLARLGGDEFVALATGLDNLAQAEIIAEKLVSALSKPMQLMQHDITVNVSIGIAVFPDHGTRIDSLLQYADTACNRAKSSGRNTWAMFMGESDTITAAPLKLQTQLMNAIEKDELVLFYQPQINKRQHVIGVEALVRWQHPERGLLPPLEFIPFAEETGLILRLGDWILEKACWQQRQWQLMGIDKLKVAVNISALQFIRPGFVHSVRRVLELTGADPNFLELEITEGALVQPGEQMENQLKDLKSIGVSLALDDFGTGYSCLSYLKRLPIDQIKIDRSFVKDLPHDREDAAIANATMSIAHDLGLTVVAEGVENEAQFRYLLERDCEFMQGYYFSKPLPPDKFLEFYSDANENKEKDEELFRHH